MDFDLTKYYFNSENWDAPEIVDSEGNVIDTLNTSEDMFSFVIIDGIVYVSHNTSHYGAILKALLERHHLSSEEQLVAKFKMNIDELLEEVRHKEVKEEGRFWCKYNIIENCGWHIFTNEIINQVCEKVGVDKKQVYLLADTDNSLPYMYYKIKKYINTVNESIIDELGENGGKFKPTVEWMQVNYDKATRELFNGRLGACTLIAKPRGIRRLGTFLMDAPQGTLWVDKRTRRLYAQPYIGSDKIWITRDNFVRYCYPTIILNTSYSGTENMLYNTLVHEMCHYWVNMQGWCPKQAHGKEFRDIASIVAYRSNGKISIHRLATAEEMQDYELDADLQAKKNKLAQAKIARRERQKTATNYYIIVRLDGSLRLVKTDSAKVLKDIRDVEDPIGSAIYNIGDSNICAKFYAIGYKKSFRTYRYWSLNKNNVLAEEALNSELTKEI